MGDGSEQWEAEYEAHRFDDELEWAREEEQRLDQPAEPELVHGRPHYLGSGVSEFPCRLDGRLMLLVSDEVEDITCPECVVAERKRIAQLSKPLRDEAADALLAGLGYTHARPDARTERTPCGVRVDRGMSGNAGEPRIVSTRPGDRINCLGCIAVIGQVP
jgi:hypothetical protein